MTTPAANPNTVEQFVLLEGIKHGNRFFTTHTPGDDPTKSATGETWYRLLGYAVTVEEAQRKLYGRSFTQNAICTQGHAAIAYDPTDYEDGGCPLCAALRQVDSLTDELREAQAAQFRREDYIKDGER